MRDSNFTPIYSAFGFVCQVIFAASVGIVFASMLNVLVWAIV